MNSNSLHETNEQLIGQADQLYAGRRDIANISKSIELLRNGESDCYEIAWRLGRALFFAGQESQPGEVARRFHSEGVEAGRKAAKARSDRVEGHFWLGVNLALLARFEPPSKGAAHALQAKRELLRAIANDAAYNAAGPLRVLARLQHKLPRLLGGGVPKARANFERALGIAPANTVTRIYFAELLLDVGETTRARSELEQVLNVPFDPAWAFETERDQRLAKEMLKKLSHDFKVSGQ